MNAELTVVKANGDLTGANTHKFKSDLLAGLRANSGGLLVDLARPSAIDGKALASLLMAQRSASAFGKSFQIKLDHPEWQEFPLVTGLSDVIES